VYTTCFSIQKLRTKSLWCH